MAGMIGQSSLLKVITILLICAKEKLKASPVDLPTLDAHPSLFEDDDSEEIEHAPAECYCFVGGELVQVKTCFTNHRVGPESGSSERRYPSTDDDDIEKAIKDVQGWSFEMEEQRKMSVDIAKFQIRIRKMEREEKQRKQVELMNEVKKIGSAVQAIGKFFSSIFIDFA